MSMKPRQPASAEETLTQWNQEPVEVPAAAGVGHPKNGSTDGSATKIASPPALERRVTSLRPMRAPTTTNHMRPCCHVSDSNRNISLSFEVCPGEWGRIIRCQAQGLADEVAQDGVGHLGMGADQADESVDEDDE